MLKELTPTIIKTWLTLVTSTFNVYEIWNEVGIKSAQGKNHLRVILFRLEEQGVIVNLGGGKYRKIDNTAHLVDWQQADPNKTVPLLFPFGEHDLCKVFPKSIIIVAGSKNAGKTAYLYNFIKLNMTKFGIDLYNSETSPEQMNERFSPLDIPNPAPFNVYERYDNFADVVNPDRISVIDYLDLNSEVYLVGAEIDAIFRKLVNGVAIVALQKPPPAVVIVKGIKKLVERDLAYGGGFTAKRAILYITMGSSHLKLLYVKTPRKAQVNPNNMQWSFRISEDGIHFEDIQRYYVNEDDYDS